MCFLIVHNSKKQTSESRYITKHTRAQNGALGNSVFKWSWKFWPKRLESAGSFTLLIMRNFESVKIQQNKSETNLWNLSPFLDVWMVTMVTQSWDQGATVAPACVRTDPAVVGSLRTAVTFYPIRWCVCAATATKVHFTDLLLCKQHKSIILSSCLQVTQISRCCTSSTSL